MPQWSVETSKEHLVMVQVSVCGSSCSLVSVTCAEISYQEAHARSDRGTSHLKVSHALFPAHSSMQSLLKARETRPRRPALGTTVHNPGADPVRRILGA